jgi:hypothetical protein
MDVLVTGILLDPRALRSLLDSSNFPCPEFLEMVHCSWNNIYCGTGMLLQLGTKAPDFKKIPNDPKQVHMYFDFN